ncbi:MAG TPA: hypothetical protein VNJ54_17860 [Plantibacter sp.]|uniref:hypothetical protein n=1 Tax=unclassified Plantibacter TaxID=2624265 RepID=UPI002C273403|nr:hypothetical protein [Plantibacter sp.]
MSDDYDAEYELVYVDKLPQLQRVLEDGSLGPPLQLTVVDRRETFFRALLDNPSLLVETLLVVGRNVRSDQGVAFDVLAVDIVGCLYAIIVEPQTATLPTLECGVKDMDTIYRLGIDEVRGMYVELGMDGTLDEAFGDAFGCDLPALLDSSPALRIIAGAFDYEIVRSNYLLEESRLDTDLYTFLEFIEEGETRSIASWVMPISDDDYQYRNFEL